MEVADFKNVVGISHYGMIKMCIMLTKFMKSL